jgi:hypothetical protein
VKRAAVLLLVLAFTTQAVAGPRKVLVLPVDGNADAATRAKLTASIQRLARVVDGQVQPGDATFADTAVVVGCDPKTSSCAEDVRTTLGVEELVYGTATVQQGQVTVVVRRKLKGAPVREVTTTMGEKDAPEKLEPRLLPLFGTGTPPTDVALVPPDPPPDRVVPDPAPPDPVDPVPDLDAPMPEVPKAHRRDRNLGIAASAGGGVLLLIGFALWSSKSSVQGDIDTHPTATVEDLQDLRALEDKAATRANVGNLMVLGGLALGGVGGWLLWRDHKAQLVVTPTVTDHGAAMTLTFGARP